MNTSLSKERKEHEVKLKDRGELSLSGVEDIISFDEAQVELCTTHGLMSIDGEQLKISFLDKDGGVLTLTGVVSGIYYTDKKPRVKRGLFGARQE